MEKKQILEIWNNFGYIMNKLPSPGVLAVTGNNSDKENIITLGWMTFGYLWNEVVVSILVRPTRYSYSLLQKYPEFTLNILSDKYKKAIDFCGSKSGSFCDKFSETNLTKLKSKEISVSSIAESDLVLECKLVQTNKLDRGTLSDLYRAKFYTDGNYHDIFTGVILRVNKNQ